MSNRLLVKLIRDIKNAEAQPATTKQMKGGRMIAGAMDTPAKGKRSYNLRGPRAPSEYNMFIRANINRPELKELSPKDRMRALGSLWQASKKA